MSTEPTDIFSVPDHIRFWNFRQKVAPTDEAGVPFDGYHMAEWRSMPWLHQFATYKVLEDRGFACRKGDPNLFRNMPDEELTRALNLWRPCRGSVPEEILESDHVEAAVIEKFSTLLLVAACLAEQYWFYRKGPGVQPLNSRVVVQPGFDHATVFLAWDTHRQIVLLEGCQKAWDFHFDCLTAMANQMIWWAGTMLEQLEASRA